jgi:hypothetical protein
MPNVVEVTFKPDDQGLLDFTEKSRGAVRRLGEEIRGVSIAPPITVKLQREQ